MSIQNTLDDAAFLIKKEKKEEARRSEASGAIYNTLLNYIEFLTRQTTVQRTIMQAKLLQANVSSQQPEGTQNIVRLYEKALKAQKALSSLERETTRASLNEFTDLYLTTMISYLISLHYFSLKKYQESYTMY